MRMMCITALGGVTMEYPTAETIAEWDDASLFTAAGYRAGNRASGKGFGSLNEAERVVFRLWELESEGFNGGIGQWLFNVHPQTIAQTAWACEVVGAESCARLVSEVVGGLQNPLMTDDWWGYLHSLPVEVPQRFEAYAGRFAEVEQELLACAYRYVRERWADVHWV
jgi:hypothetical protein